MDRKPPEIQAVISGVSGRVRNFVPIGDRICLWANTKIGEGQVGCIYSAQGFEFDSVVRNSGDEMVNLVRNAYRVLLTKTGLPLPGENLL